MAQVKKRFLEYKREAIKESRIKQPMKRPRGETWRARAQERKGCFQALSAGISTQGEDGAVAGKAENH
jgi:hypothetical protein